VETAKFPWAASGRAIANGADYGFTKLIFDAETHRVIGGTIVGPSAGDMIGSSASGRDGRGCGGYRQDHPPPPTLGETVGMAAEVAHGSCTDVPRPARSKRKEPCCSVVSGGLRAAFLGSPITEAAVFQLAARSRQVCCYGGCARPSHRAKDRCRRVNGLRKRSPV
jgi:hypothetical protein